MLKQAVFPPAHFHLQWFFFYPTCSLYQHYKLHLAIQSTADLITLLVPLSLILLRLPPAFSVFQPPARVPCLASPFTESYKTLLHLTDFNLKYKLFIMEVERFDQEEQKRTGHFTSEKTLMRQSILLLSWQPNTFLSLDVICFSCRGYNRVWAAEGERTKLRVKKCISLIYIIMSSSYLLDILTRKSAR